VSSSDAAFYEQEELWGAAHIENTEHLRMRYDAIDQLLPAGVRTVAELGSGDGRVLNDLQVRRGGALSTIALDRSRVALRHQDRPCVAASIEATPLVDRAVDLALCCEVLEHLPYPIYERARRELTRVADRWILLTVPNRENRRRAAVRCPGCGCEYNPMRHVRSFDENTLHGAFEGFRLIATLTAGPRSVVYPRAVRRGLERAGILTRSGTPVCPQCDRPFDTRAPYTERSPELVASAPLRTTSSAVRRLVPKGRHRYWLCALYERAG
jgi:hypothetical protein